METLAGVVVDQSGSRSRLPGSGQVFDAQAMPAQGADDFSNRRFSLRHPEFVLALAFSELPALLFAIIKLGKGGAQSGHQLLEALIAHRHMRCGSIVLRDVASAQALVCEGHRYGYRVTAFWIFSVRSILTIGLR